MSVTFFGNAFSIKDQWGRQEHNLIKSVQQQIDQAYTSDNNILINLTWFGPQFDNTTWHKIKAEIAAGRTYDRLFWLSAVDPICISPDLFKEIEHGLGVKHVYYVGGFDNSPYAFHLSAVATLEDFVHYNKADIILKDPTHLFLCYNRKPKSHRIQLVEKLLHNSLDSFGVVTLGKNDSTYDVSQGIKTDLYLTIDDPVENYTHNGKFLMHNNFGRVPYDLCSLGRLDIWQGHFLNIVSETEFLPWDNLFVTEKTWKPIIGLRPFVLNGQTKIYKYLRDNGFKTFTHCFNGIELEDIKEFEVHDAIVNVIKYLISLDKAQILSMYNDMLPALKYNRNRFFEFANEQQYKIDHLFKL